VDQGVVDTNIMSKPLTTSYKSEFARVPSRLEGNDLYKYSKVIGQSATCKRMDFKRYNKSEDEILEIIWEEAPNTAQRSNGMLREGTAARAERNRFSRTSIGSLFLPYFIGFVVFVFVVGIALRTRSDHLVGKRTQPV